MIVHFGRMLLDMAARITWRGSPAKRCCIEITTIERHARRGAHRHVDDGRELGLERLEERCFERDLLEDVVFGHGLAGQQALEDRIRRCVIAVIVATGLSEAGV